MGEIESTQQIGLRTGISNLKIEQREYLEHKKCRSIRTGRTKGKHKTGGTNRPYGTATKIWNRWK